MVNCICKLHIFDGELAARVVETGAHTSDRERLAVMDNRAVDDVGVIPLHLNVEHGIDAGRLEGLHGAQQVVVTHARFARQWPVKRAHLIPVALVYDPPLNHAGACCFNERHRGGVALGIEQVGRPVGQGAAGGRDTHARLELASVRVQITLEKGRPMLMSEHPGRNALEMRQLAELLQQPVA